LLIRIGLSVTLAFKTMQIQTELPPDDLEKKIRLGCGAVAGIAFGLCAGFIALELAAGWTWLLAAVVGVILALLALRFGDRFWLWLIRCLIE
jgi:hypothetical protein